MPARVDGTDEREARKNQRAPAHPEQCEIHLSGPLIRQRRALGFIADDQTRDADAQEIQQRSSAP